MKMYCQNVNNNLTTLGGLIRVGEMTLENTYLPIIQCIMGILQMSQRQDMAYQIFTMLSVGSSVFSMSTSMGFIHFSIESKQHMSTKLTAKLCFVAAMICQICSRLMTISFMGMYTFPYNNTLNWLVFGCLIHILIVLASKMIVYYNYSDYSIWSRDTLFTITLSALSSVYTNTRIGKLRLLKGLDEEQVDNAINDLIVREESKLERQDMIELDVHNDNLVAAELGETGKCDDETKAFNVKDEHSSPTKVTTDNDQTKIDSELSLVKNTRNLIRKENDYKLVDRIVFTTIIFIQQIVIMVVINLSPFPERVQKLPLNIFNLTIVPLFATGQLLEAIYYNYLNPEAKYLQRVGYRKMALSLTLFILFVAGIVGLLYVLYDLKQMGYFIIILTIIVVLILSITFYAISSSCCKRSYVKRIEKEDQSENERESLILNENL